MNCDICGRTCGSHDPRCPNFIPHKSSHYCSICDEPILENEEYIVNDNGDYRHYECFRGMRDLLKWLGYSVETMNGEDI